MALRKKLRIHFRVSLNINSLLTEMCYEHTIFVDFQVCKGSCIRSNVYFCELPTLRESDATQQAVLIKIHIAALRSRHPER